MLLELVTVVSAAGVGGAVSHRGVDSRWYRCLEHRARLPPRWLFPVVWTGLYAVLAVTLVGGSPTARRLTLLCLALGTAWCLVFFGARRPCASLTMAVGLATAATFLAVCSHSMRAGLAVHALWCLVALWLNWRACSVVL